MKLLILALCTAALAVPSLGDAGVCDENSCKIENNCRCSSSKGPAIEGELPQLVSLIFDEAVVKELYDKYWTPMLFDRVNPDGEPIGATFFVPHEYTDYSLVNELYNLGFEIGDHSITKREQEYWRNATVDELTQEFAGQKQIISKFANIPAEDIIGVRTPQLQLAGERSIQAYQKSGMLYDATWPAYVNRRYFPYTLDYKSSQECQAATECPKESYPGFWILPVLNIKGKGSIECNILPSCKVEGSADDIANWLLSETQKVMDEGRYPLTINAPSYWFNFTKNSFEGFNLYLDKLQETKKVFFVTQKQVYDWIRNPVNLENFKTEVPDRVALCTSPKNCKLEKPDGEWRYMMSCVPCPNKYPWIGNPDGK